MNIDDLTVGQIREISKMIGCGETATRCPAEIGSAVLIRTVTYHLLGRVTEIIGSWVRLEDACWVASSGRWNNALETGELAEVEVMPDGCLVNLDTAVDITPWNHDLPDETK